MLTMAAAAAGTGGAAARAPVRRGAHRRSQVHDRATSSRSAGAEYLARIEKARVLMAQARHRRVAHRARLRRSSISPASHWWRSERLTAAVLPREGDDRHRHAALRRTLGARKPAGSGRSARVARGPESARDRRRHPARSQGHGARRRRRDRALLRRRRLAQGDAARRDRERRAGGAWLPHDQVSPPSSR